VNIRTPFFPFRISAQASGFTVHVPKTGEDASQTQAPREETWTTTTEPLTETQASFLSRAVHDQWAYQGVVAGLPVWGIVGEMREDDKDGAVTDSLRPCIYTVQALMVEYNNHGESVRVDLLSNGVSLVKVQAGESYTYSFTIALIETVITWDERWNRYRV
jgi:hypothetical protein